MTVSLSRCVRRSTVALIATAALLLASCSDSADPKAGAGTKDNVGQKNSAAPKDKTVINSVGMKLVWIEKGSFDMGSPDAETGREANETQHRVTLTKGFYMGATEVTQTQWVAVMGNNPSSSRGENLPVEKVSWNDAMDFCKKLSQKEGRTYRLPTEAQWEYACRAGSTTTYHEGNTEGDLAAVGWYGYDKGNSDKKTHLVGQKKANAWGLYDMHGNVYEWCSDWYGEYANGAATDPAGPVKGTERVLRGGCFVDRSAFCRSAHRSKGALGRQFFSDGLRVVLDSSESAGQKMTAGQTDNVSHKANAEPNTRTLTNSVGIKLVWIEKGSFDMGSPRNEPDRGDDEVRHRVAITKSFYMGTTEVTQAQWLAVMGTTPWKGRPFTWEGDDYPVTYVSWEDATDFCRKLSLKEGKTYRLPTEAEWEYACRAGTTTPFHTGATISTLEANYDGDSYYGLGYPGVNRQKTIAAGSLKKPNAWGLHDMHGNVWEWCSDWYGDYPDSAVTDPSGPQNGTERVLRGGSWNISPKNCRSATRNKFSPDYRPNYFGFRVVLESAE